MGLYVGSSKTFNHRLSPLSSLGLDKCTSVYPGCWLTPSSVWRNWRDLHTAPPGRAKTTTQLVHKKHLCVLGHDRSRESKPLTQTPLLWFQPPISPPQPFRSLGGIQTQVCVGPNFGGCISSSPDNSFTSLRSETGTPLPLPTGDRGPHVTPTTLSKGHSANPPSVATSVATNPPLS